MIKKQNMQVVYNKADSSMHAEYLHIISHKTKDVPTIVVILLLYNEYNS